MDDMEFIAEIRRHVIAIIKAFAKHYHINLLDLPSPYGSGQINHDEPPESRLVLTGEPTWKEHSKPKEH